MKKTRLLEIIREEISYALKENYSTTEASCGSSIKEDQLNEMASLRQLKTQLKKQEREDELKAVESAEKTTIEKLSQNPEFSGEGKDKRLKGYVKNFKKELESTHGIDLKNLLFDVAEKAEKAGDKFNDDIASNTIEKDAAKQILGKSSSPTEPTEEIPTDTTDVEDITTDVEDEMDVNVVDMDDDSKSAMQNIGSDKTAKELGSTPEDKKEKFNLGLKFIKKYSDDKAKVDAYLKKAKEEYKLTKGMLDDLKRAAGREV